MASQDRAFFGQDLLACPPEPGSNAAGNHLSSVGCQHGANPGLERGHTDGRSSASEVFPVQRVEAFAQPRPHFLDRVEVRRSSWHTPRSDAFGSHSVLARRSFVVAENLPRAARPHRSQSLNGSGELRPAPCSCRRLPGVERDDAEATLRKTAP